MSSYTYYIICYKSNSLNQKNKINRRTNVFLLGKARIKKQKRQLDIKKWRRKRLKDDKNRKILKVLKPTFRRKKNKKMRFYVLISS